MIEYPSDDSSPSVGSSFGESERMFAYGHLRISERGYKVSENAVFDLPSIKTIITFLKP